jgi:hypothetical protein
MWLRTDERNEAIKSLHKTHQFVLEAHEDNYNWKWVIIAIHNSAQAFMILALKGTASFNVCSNREKFLEAMSFGNDYPELRMQYFLDLYRDIKSKERMNQGVSSKKFLASPETDQALKALNELRNKFIHFVPSNWSLEVSALPEICKSTLSVIEFLILESGNIRFYNNDELEKARLSKLISEIKVELEKLRIDYSTLS